MRLLECLQLPEQLVELGVGDDRCVPHVVAELMLADLIGQFLPAPTQVGVRAGLGLFGERRRRIVGRHAGVTRGIGIRRWFRAHPGRLTDPSDTVTLALCRTRSCSATTIPGWPSCAASRWDTRKRSRRSPG